MTDRKIAFILALLSFIFALAINEINLFFLKKEAAATNTALLRYNQTIAGPDDSDYFTPPRNFINGKGWYDDSHPYGKAGYFWRTPGYMIFYMLFTACFGEEGGLMVLKYAQVLLFALSVYCLFFIISWLTNSRKLAIVFTSLYGLTPLGPGILYLTLTESITPALVIFYIYFLLGAFRSDRNRKKNTAYFLASFFISYAILTRPVLAILFLSLPIVVFFDYSKNNGRLVVFKKIFLFCSIASLFIVLWEIRSYAISGRIMSPQPLYYSESNIVYRPTFKYIWKFTKCWGEDATNLNSYMMPIYDHGIKGDSSETYIDKAIAGMPADVVDEIGRARIFSALKEYQQTVLHQKTFLDKNLPMPETVPEGEQKVISEFSKFTDEFRSARPFQYYLQSPWIYFKRMVFHSNTATYFIFQEKFRDITALNLTRYALFIIHALIYLLAFINLFFVKKTGILVWSLIFPVFIYMIFILFFHREVDQRYFSPILVCLLAIAPVTLQNLTTFALSKITKR